jgi:TM2 domain-containing membrane protein YozV
VNYKILIFIIILFITFAQAQEKIKLPFNSGISYLSARNNQIIKPAQNPFNFYQQNDMPEMVGQKSTGLAFFLSLALPGSGEFYMGRRTQTAWFLTTEILLWTGLAANSLYTDHLVEEYRIYAIQHASVNRDSKDKQYWMDIGKYNSIYDFNEQRRRDRYFDEIYLDEEANFWLWDSKENRLKYDESRLRANEIANQSVYFFASIVLNHLISAVNSLRIARKHNRELANKANWSLGIRSYKIESKRYYGLNFSTSF